MNCFEKMYYIQICRKKLGLLFKKEILNRIERVRTKRV